MEHLKGSLLGPALALLVNIRLGWKGLDKHSSVLQLFAIYGRKSFITLGSDFNVMKHFYHSQRHSRHKVKCLSLSSLYDICRKV